MRNDERDGGVSPLHQGLVDLAEADLPIQTSHLKKGWGTVCGVQGQTAMVPSCHECRKAYDAAEARREAWIAKRRRGGR